MTNFSALSAFLADADIESLRKRGLDEFGVDICGVYCLHTGRKVGSFDDLVIQFAIDEESIDDEDQLLEALFARVVMSMRPTPMLNRPDRITLRNLADKHPVDIMAYLVNRLHSNRWIATHRNMDLLDPYVARIHSYTRWQSLAAAGVDLTPWIHWLLELDSKRNLHDLTPPCVSVDRLNKWFISNIGDSLLYLVTADNAADMLAIFESWVMEQVAAYDRRDVEALRESQFMRGNSLTQPAYVQSWIENPQFASKKAEAAHKAKNKPVTPAKPKSERTTKLNARVNEFLHLLDGILDNDEPVVTQKPKPKLLTGGMLFARKESI